VDGDATGSVLRRFPDFRRLFAGNTVSLLGSSVTAVALPLTAVGYLHASAVQMGLLGAVALLPHLVLGLPAGVWVDRLPYRRVLVAADLGQLVLVGAVPVLALCGVLRIWQLYLVVALAGVGSLFETVTAQSFTPRLVPRDRLLPANSALMVSNATVGTVGSALAGVLVAALTAPVAIAADALSFLLAAVCKSRIRDPGLPATPTRPATPDAAEGPASSTTSGGAGRPRLAKEVWDGLRVMFAHPVLRPVTIGATVGALAGQMQGVMLVLFLVRGVGLPTGLVGGVVAVGAAAGILGGLLATPVTRRVGPGRAFLTGQLVLALSGVVLAAAGGPLPVALGVVAVGQVLRGAGPPLFGVNQQTFRQTLVAPELVSRVNATWRFLVFGMQPIGALLGGLLGAAVGLRGALLAGSAVMLLGVTVAAASPLRNLRTLPPATATSPSATTHPRTGATRPDTDRGPGAGGDRGAEAGGGVDAA
jgi:MFS family permease